MAYGTQNVILAQQQFSENFSNFNVPETGLWINNRFPGLGASPDDQN